MKFWRYYVYLHKKLSTGEVFYVGKGTVRKRSKYVNYERAYSKSRRSDIWTNTANKHGYSVEIIAMFETDKLSQEFEKKLISKYGRKNLKDGSLVNLTDGGDGHAGLVISQSQREIRSLNAKKKRSPLWVQSIRRARKNGGNGGVVKKGDKLPDEWKKNISKGVSGENNSQYGKVTKIARKVIDSETGTEFESVSSAAEFIGINMKTLYNKLSGHRKNDTALRFA